MYHTKENKFYYYLPNIAKDRFNRKPYLAHMRNFPAEFDSFPFMSRVHDVIVN